jgi:hypothetical protein
MDKIVSSSPDRKQFQINNYIRRCQERNELVNQSYIDLFNREMVEHLARFDNPKTREFNLEYDLLTTEWILEKVRGSTEYAQNLYAALCNNYFQRLEVIPILKNQTWSCSWRYAGGIISDMRQEGDYADWYCSGITDGIAQTIGYTSEGSVTPEIRDDLRNLGWVPLLDKDYE